MKTLFVLFLTLGSILSHAQMTQSADTITNAFYMRSMWTRPVAIKVMGGLDPIYVIDGEVVPTEKAEQMDPETIGSISVIKDPVVLETVYKAMPGHGVVLITTKARALDSPTIEPIRADAIDNTISIRSMSPGPTFRVIGGGLAPVYVIDGVVVANEKAEQIDPGTIASIEVLKNPALAALYKTKPGRGIILINTKAHSVATNVPAEIKND